MSSSVYPRPRFVVHHIVVQMGTGEWDNGELMQDIAKEQIKLHHDKAIVVSVHEHGGWFLQFVAHPDQAGDVMVVGTANDTATWRPPQIEMRRFLRESDWVYMPSVKRPDKPRQLA